MWNNEYYETVCSEINNEALSEAEIIYQEIREETIIWINDWFILI